MSDDAPLVLVDGSSYLFRAFHALPPLTNKDGEPTGAMYGVLNMLRKLAADYPGSPMAVVFDASGKTFRNDLYSDYKANRPPMPDDLRSQIAPLKDAVAAEGWPLLVVPDVEADDVIGTLARQASAAGRATVISTGDKDMAQLVDEHVTLVNTMTDVTMDADGVLAKFDVPPERIVDLLALMGDSVDNIPGVQKCGPKTAVKWLKAHGDLDGVMANADAIKGKVGDNLRAALDDLPLSRELATIRTDVDLEFGIDELERSERDNDALVALYQRYEFRTWLAELQAGDDQPDPVADADYSCISTAQELDAWVARLQDAELFAVDTETTSLDYMQADLVGVSFAVAPGEAAYVPFGHRYTGAPEQLDEATVLAALKPLLEDPERPKVGQHLKYDMNVLARHGITLRGVAYDTMLESYVLDSVATRHNMDALALKYLGRSTIRFEDIAGKGAKQLTFDQVPVEQAAPYAAEDADVTLQLHHTLYPRLQAEDGLIDVFRDIEMPLVPVLSAMERRGARVDGKVLERQSAEIAKRLAELQEEAFGMAGEEFNLDSTKQLQAVLYDKLELPVLRKTPGGKPSTAEPVLQELAHDYELPRLIMEYRSLAKLKGTYTDKLPLQINPDTGRIHTSYHQAVAATGRLSSSDPNLQNIPIRTAAGRRVRQAFVPPDGQVLLAADYSQIELRIMAHLSQDAGLVAAFEAGLDIHRATAAEVFGVEPDAVSDDQRRSAKAINFGLIYGMSAYGLARQIDVTRAVATDYIERYFARYPGVRRYMDETREQAREQGYVSTLYGRRLYLPEIKASNGARRQAAERTAINAPMQGSAADIIKRAMLAVEDWLAGADLGAQVIMQVHDELVLEVPKDAVDAVSEGITERMVGAADMRVPLEVGIGTGANWDEAH